MTSKLDVHVETLATNPDDPQAFEALEEGYFLAGAWEKLLALYRQRLDAPSSAASEVRGPLLFRAGQILEERQLDVDAAIQHYTEAIQIDSTYRPALRQLRQIYRSRGAWDMVLQIAEVEIATPMEPYQRAAFFAEMGCVWLDQVGDANEASSCFEQALSIDPEQKDALGGLARTLEAKDRPDAAAAIWERLIGCIRGPDRAAPEVALARLLAGPLQDTDTALEYYRRALADDPNNSEAVEAMVDAERTRENWSELATLYERQFSLAAGARRRTQIALEAGRTRFEKQGDGAGARDWYDRALELSSEDSSVHLAIAELNRHEGNLSGLMFSLERIIELEADRAPLNLMLEAAELCADKGEDPRALGYLKAAQRKSPDDPLVLEALSAAFSSLALYDELTAVLEQRASLVDSDAESRAAALLELAALQEVQLDDAEAARDACERAFAEDPACQRAAQSLERLYRKDESWQQLVAMLERAAGAGAETERPGFYCSLGEIRNAHFSDPNGARQAFEAALQLEVATPRALRGLEGIARDSGDHDALLAAFEYEAGVTSDPERLRELSLELSKMLEATERPEEALVWAEKHLAVAVEDRGALESVARLQEQLGRVDCLSATLGRLDDVLRGAEQAAVRRRIAEQHEAAQDEDAAISYWEAALESDPNDEGSLRALRSRYASRRRAEDLAPILRKLSEILTAAEQVECLDELAVLLEEQLGDLDGAIVVSWRLSGMRDRPEGVEDRLEALLERTGRYEELVQKLLERRRGLPEDSEFATAIELRRALLLLDQLGQFEEAARAFASVRAQKPDSAEAAEGMERALRAANDCRGLVELLGELCRSEGDPEKQQRRAFERATLLEEELDETEAARSAYEELACADGPDDLVREASLRLESLLERTASWTALREQLERRAERSTPDDALPLHERLAALHRDELADLEGCIRHLEAAGKIRPDRAEAWRQLGGLYEELGREDDLLRVIDAELETNPDAQHEAGLHARAAAMWAERDDQTRASQHYERLLELSPGHAAATEFLVAQHTQSNRHADIVWLLESRLEAITAEQSDEQTRGQRISLRLRIATILSEELDDLPGGIEVLEPAVAEEGPGGATATPLADLYRLAGRAHDLALLCRSAAAACTSSSEKALWLLRLGDALKDDDDTQGAGAAYREALVARPSDRDATELLCDLYRQTGDAAPLAQLLEAEIAQACRSDEVALRMELAQLLEDSLSRADDALAHLQRVIELESDHVAAFDHAMHLATQLGQHDTELQLIYARLEQRLPASSRCELLERSAELLAGPIDACENAITTYREAIALDPSRRSARNGLRDVLERLERWPAVLDCLYIDSTNAEPAERGAILERAVEIAAIHLGPDASLPWLERLRVERPEEALIIARIADVHRLAGRFEAVLRALDDELGLDCSQTRRRELHLGRALILERDMHAPGRAISALEAAREVSPNDPETLRHLDQLYAATGRLRERVGIIEARIDAADEAEIAAVGSPLELHQTAARLWCDELGEPERGVPHLLRALFETTELLRDRPPCDESPSIESGSGAACRNHEQSLELLRQLQDALEKGHHLEAWARACEVELHEIATCVESGGPEPADARVATLHRDLARAYLGRVPDGDRAKVHLRALVEQPEGTTRALGSEEFEKLELSLIDRVRRDNDWLELGERLRARVERVSGTADEWLELARLEEERLHAPGEALHAYRCAWRASPECLLAIRGTARLAELLGDWQTVISAIDLELRTVPDRPALERATLFRKAGGVCWHRLQSTELAAVAYGSALEAQPDDVEALRALQGIHEVRGDWPKTLDAFEREVEILGETDSSRRRSVWLHVAAIASRHTDEPGRALAGYEKAAEIDALESEDQRNQAELYQLTGAHKRFAEVFGHWCDSATSGAEGRDHLRLSQALAELGRDRDALARAKVSTEVEPELSDAWDAIAALHQRLGDCPEAADALERAAELVRGAQASERFVASALLIEQPEIESALIRLRRAVEADAGSALAHAHLARVAGARENWEEAERAAGTGLDLSAASATPLQDEVRLEVALVGGRSAQQREQLDAAALFYSSALEVDPQHKHALEQQAGVLFERGDLSGTRMVLEARLAQGGQGTQHAERLGILATVLELEGEHQDALGRFRDALREDPDLQVAQGGVARICERLGQVDEAIEALASAANGRLAASASNPADAASGAADAASRRVHAAELELERNCPAAAQPHLLAAIGANSDNARAWVLLIEVLSDLGCIDDLLRQVPAALANDSVSDAADAMARMALLYARALERRGAGQAAAAAYCEALSGDPRCTEAALAASRLLRQQGAWREAADVLERFCDRHPECDHRDLAEVHFKLAGLLAGPLEDVGGAIDSYERSLEIVPESSQARGPLASLLVHVPDRWRDALGQHRQLLREDPTRTASIRSLQQLADRRENQAASLVGLSLLRAVGAASPAERSRAPDRLPEQIGGDGTFEDPLWETARCVARLAAEPLAQVRGTSTAGTGAAGVSGEHPDQPSLGNFVASVAEIEAEIGVPGLAGLDAAGLRDLLSTVAALAVGDGSGYDAENEAETGDAGYAIAGESLAALQRSLGRWTRRKIRRALDGVTPEDIYGIDFEAWTTGLRARAAARAVDLMQGDLRTALCALCLEQETLSDTGLSKSSPSKVEMSETEDLSLRIAGTPLATALLAHIEERWCNDFLDK